MHLTIPKGSMGYTKYTVPGTVAVEPTFVPFVAFLKHLQTYVHGLSGLLHAPFSDSLSRNSFIQ